MAPLIVLVVAFAVFALAKLAGVRALSSWRVVLRWALAVMFLVTAQAHFGSRRPDLIAMVPAVFPRPDLLVTVTGIAELLGALGLLVPRVAPVAALSLALLLVAMFPANVHAARASLSIGGQPATPLLLRTVLQLLFVGALLVAARTPRGRPGVRESNTG